jgi:hypothetical protein
MLTSLIWLRTSSPQLLSSALISLCLRDLTNPILSYLNLLKQRYNLLDLCEEKSHLFLTDVDYLSQRAIFLLWYSTIDQTSSSISPLFRATLWVSLCITCFTIISAKRSVYRLHVPMKSNVSLNGFLQV